MLSHKEIWRAIDLLAQQKNLSISGLAKKAGLDPTAFNKSKRLAPSGHMRWPTTESIARLLECTNTSLADFLSLSGEKISPKPEEIPFIDWGQALEGNHFDDKGQPTGEGWVSIVFPQIEEKNVYAIEISGNSFLPIYRESDILIISSTAHMRRGDRVVTKTHSGDLFIHVFGRKTAKTLDLFPLHAAGPVLSLALSEVAWVSRILWASQ